MLKRLLFYSSIILLIGCSKQADESLNPDLTVGLTGTYPLTYYRNGTQILNFPNNSVAAEFDVAKVDLTHVKAQLTFKFTSFTSVASVNTVELKRSDTDHGLYTMSKSGRNVGTITASTMEVNDISADSIVTQITAKR